MADSAHLIHTARLRALQSYLDARRLDALVVSTPMNIAYLSGFVGSAGLLLITREGLFLLVDGRYEVAARESLGAGKLGPVTVERVDSRYDQALASVIAREGLQYVGLEAGNVTVATLSAWRRAVAGVEWRDRGDDGSLAERRSSAVLPQYRSAHHGGDIHRGGQFICG